MISVETAKAILIESIVPTKKTTVLTVSQTLGYRLATDIYSPIQLPPFNQSNVDGYAVNLSDLDQCTWTVVGEIKAGDAIDFVLQKGEAVRIFTGAMVPEGSDLVVMQEHVKREFNKLSYVGKAVLAKGEHVRFAGAQIKKDALAVSSDVLITPSVISFLNAMGIDKVAVHQKPQIGLIITGNELQQSGSVLELGKVYESNANALQAVIGQMGLLVATCVFVKDDKQSLKEAVERILHRVDVLLVSGGISVGDYDFVHDVLTEAGTETKFYKVAQKPGKPLFFGQNNNTCVFGLPGNPASALTCFYEYVYPALRLLMGRSKVFVKSQQMQVTKAIAKKPGLSHFLKASVKGNTVEPLSGQESFITKSLAESDAFIYLSAERQNIEIGEMVEVHLLPEL